jgi:hypothetical protein
MDRKWMSANRLSLEYENGVDEFIDFARRHIVVRASIFVYAAEFGVAA